MVGVNFLILAVSSLRGVLNTEYFQKSPQQMFGLSLKQTHKRRSPAEVMHHLHIENGFTDILLHLSIAKIRAAMSLLVAMHANNVLTVVKNKIRSMTSTGKTYPFSP